MIALKRLHTHIAHVSFFKKNAGSVAQSVASPTADKEVISSIPA